MNLPSGTVVLIDRDAAIYRIPREELRFVRVNRHPARGELVLLEYEIAGSTRLHHISFLPQLAGDAQYLLKLLGESGDIVLRRAHESEPFRKVEDGEVVA